MLGKKSGDRKAERRASELYDRATRLATAGRAAQALAAFEEAATVVRGLCHAYPHDPRHLRNLASILYDLGSTLNAIGQFDGAMQTLDECEEAYLALAARGDGDVTPLIADVHMRKGLTLMARGHGASAMTELDGAVATYAGLSARDASSPHHLDLARVLSVNAAVLHAHGDHDLAVASADLSIRMYVGRAAEINGSADSMTHTVHLRLAAGVAARIHAERGRLHLAADADRFAVHTATAAALATKAPADVSELASALARQGFHLQDGGDQEQYDRLVQKARGLDAAAVDREAEAWAEARTGNLPLTLAGALDVAAWTPGVASVPDIVRGLVNDPNDRASAVCASERCSLQVAPAIAFQLADLALALMPSEPPAALRLGLETHCLLAASSRARVPAMRREFGVFGGQWARLLLAFSRSCLADGNRTMAQDLAGWLGGVVAQLAPLSVDDPDLAALVAECDAFLALPPRG